MMDPQLTSLMERYLRAEAGRRELADLIDGYDIWNKWQDDDPGLRPLRDVAGKLELLICDIDEGLRDEEELRNFVVQALSANVDDGPTPIDTRTDEEAWFQVTSENQETTSLQYGIFPATFPPVAMSGNTITFAVAA